jgi:hypothetical protein
MDSGNTGASTTLSSIIMMMEDAKLYHKDFYVMYVDFKGAFNADDHRIMFKHMRQLGMPLTFFDTCEHLYGVSSTEYITPYGPTPSIVSNGYTEVPSPGIEPAPPCPEPYAVTKYRA